MLASKIETWESSLPENAKLAYLPQPGIVRLRLSITGEKESASHQIIESEIEKLRHIIPEEIFGYDEDTLELVVGKLLQQKKLTMSTAESCTGGYIAHLITSIPGSSTYFKGSTVAYANEIKENVLNVSTKNIEEKGAVSEEVVSKTAGLWYCHLLYFALLLRQLPL